MLSLMTSSSMMSYSLINRGVSPSSSVFSSIDASNRNVEEKYTERERERKRQSRGQKIVHINANEREKKRQERKRKRKKLRFSRIDEKERGGSRREANGRVTLFFLFFLFFLSRSSSSLSCACRIIT